MPSVRSYAFYFVCQEGALEGMALLLAASLKRYLRCEYELIAIIPTPSELWGTVNPETFEILAEMGVRISYINNPTERIKKGDQLTNKLYCLQVPTKMDKAVFVDSDILCLREFDDEPRFAAQFNAAPTFKATGRNWENIYAAVGLPMTSDRMMTLFSEEEQPPYFNSGFFTVDSSLSKTLVESWFECFNLIDQSGAMEDNPYFREQVSLSMAVMKLGLKYDVLDWRYNYWVKSAPVKTDDLPYFLHHTWPKAPIFDQPILKEMVQSYVREYPGIEKFVAQCRWKYYLEKVSVEA